MNYFFIFSITFEKYKYEVWGTILDMMYQGKTEESIIEDIINAYDDTLEALEGEEDENELSILLTDELKKLL